jgi:hypothetical protein
LAVPAAVVVFEAASVASREEVAAAVAVVGFEAVGAVASEAVAATLGLAAATEDSVVLHQVREASIGATVIGAASLVGMSREVAGAHMMTETAAVFETEADTETATEVVAQEAIWNQSAGETVGIQVETETGTGTETGTLTGHETTTTGNEATRVVAMKTHVSCVDTKWFDRWTSMFLHHILEACH